MPTIKFASKLMMPVPAAPQAREQALAATLVNGYFPPGLQERVLAALDCGRQAEEIRCRTGQPVQIRFHDGDVLLGGDVLSGDELGYMLQRMNQSSLYAWEEEYRRGYLTLAGGHRVGLAGKTLLRGGEVRTMRGISSLNFRLARAVPGAADKVMNWVLHEGRVNNVLIAAPPGCGKTTLLRDVIRQLSNGITGRCPGFNVAVVDERSELAGMVDGQAQMDLGCRTDVLDGCPKSQGMTMMIRSMAPEVLITDEIGTEADIHALEEALSAGVAVISTVHGRDWADLRHRPNLQRLLADHYFQRIIFLSKRRGPGTVEQVMVWDGQDYALASGAW